MIATYNKAPYLDRVLHSIRVQDVPFPYEAIVVDDGSTDGTREVCEKYGVRYLRRDSSQYENPGLARNVGYRAARGEILICQSDEVIHHSPEVIRSLVEAMRPGTCVFATVHNARLAAAGVPTPERNPVAYVSLRECYTGPENQRPLFFLGAIYRSDMYAVGGNDEEFTIAGYEDTWLGDCLTRGLGLQPVYLTGVVGLHQHHARPRKQIGLMKRLYQEKRRRAEAGEIKWESSGGPWPLGD